MLAHARQVALEVQKALGPSPVLSPHVTTRFAPSPTGDLHLGGAWTALAAWALARSRKGTTVLRVEDIDTPRIVTGSAHRITDDLAWLGLDWDEGPDAGGPHAPYTQ